MLNSPRLIQGLNNVFNGQAANGNDIVSLARSAIKRARKSLKWPGCGVLSPCHRATLRRVMFVTGLSVCPQGQSVPPDNGWPSGP